MATLTYQERFKTLGGVFDDFTDRSLFLLQSRKIIDDIESPLSIGKESNVFIGRKDGRKVIVKIYRVQNCDFNRMYSYIKQDPRYDYLKKHRRQIILVWAQREFKNLLKAEKAGINSPKVLGWRNHILIEEFIGNGEPAPKLKDLPPKNPKKFLQEIIDNISKLYKNGLIHGDLSSFNILNHKEKPYFIDFSQATLVKTPNSEELLLRDLENVLGFFQKLGIKRNVKETFLKVTGK